MAKNRKKVLLVGWDAADWKVINPLMDRGKMPNLERLVNRGVKGNIATLHPVLSPMLWTSIATGKRPYKHGIYGFYEPTPDGMNVQPMTNLSRKTKAIWNILNQNGMRSNVVGWWPSHPAEPLNGVMVSDLFMKESLKPGPEPLKRGAVHPAELTEELDKLRVRASELTGNDLLNFIHAAENIDQENDKRLVICGKIVAECTSIQSIATHLMETTEWDFSAIYFDAIDHFSHAFMKYHRPRRPQISEDDFEHYKDVVVAGYIYHDMMLGRLIELAGADTTIVLLSDHGFHPDHLRPDFIPFEPAGPAIEHRDLGIFVIAGPDIKSDELVFGTSLLDITPTLLTIFGLPVGEDMDGRVLSEIFKQEPLIKTVESWDAIEGEDGCHPAGMQMDSLDSQEALQQLVDLGYIDELKGSKQEDTARAVRELNFNLARAYMDAHRYNDAIPLLVDLYEDYPDQYRITMQLAMCFKATNRIDDLDEIVQRLLEQRVHDSHAALNKLAQWREEAKRRLAQKAEQEGAEGIEPEKPAKVDLMDATLFNQTEIKAIIDLRSIASVRPYYLDFLKGFALASKGENAEAVVFLERAIEAEPTKASLYLQIGETYLNLKQLDRADEAFQKAHELDENNQHVFLGFAKLHLAREEFEASAQMALKCIGITYFYPFAHYVLGLALVQLKRYQQAAGALQNSIHQNPNFAEAYRAMADLYKNHLLDINESEKHLELARQASELEDNQKNQRVRLGKLVLADKEAKIDLGFNQETMLAPIRIALANPNRKPCKEMDPETSIVVVTGLPRSGTSLMMQMLAAGGLQILQDGKREPDEDNPKGYLEYENTKSLYADNRWIDDAQGKVVKVVAPLIDSLPSKFDYKILFMYRDLDEVILSQHKMLERSGHDGADFDAVRLKSTLNYQLDAAARLLFEKGVTTYRVDYSATLASPAEAARAVKEFLCLESLDEEKMAAVVDTSLYRNRTGAGVSG